MSSHFNPKLKSHRAILAAIAWSIGVALAAVMAASDAKGAEWRPVLCEVTAYCGGPCDACETTGLTASGARTNVRPYGIAASPNVPLGALVYVPHGAGYLDRSSPNERSWRVDDRGGALRSERNRSGITRLDLRFRSHQSAVEFGRKMVLCWIYQ